MDISKIDISAIANKTFHPPDSTLGNFAFAIRELLPLLEKKSHSSAKPQNPPRPTTPVPSNFNYESRGSRKGHPHPNLSGSSISSGGSWKSGRSDSEIISQLFAYEFLKAALVAVENQLDTTPWIHEDLQQLNIVYSRFSQSSILTAVLSRKCNSDWDLSLLSQRMTGEFG